MSAYEEVDTEPNTPESSQVFQLEHDILIFARLYPIGQASTNAINQALKYGNDHHKQFIKPRDYYGEVVNCYEFALDCQPEFPTIGWRIGRGRNTLPNSGVDLLLPGTNNVASRHARFAFQKGIGGFFLVVDNKRGLKVYLNGVPYINNQSVIPFKSTIMIGECNFVFEYVQRPSKEDEDLYLYQLRKFYTSIHNEEHPIVLATPSSDDIVFGEWVVQHSISKGSFGTVFSVSHQSTGQIAAAKVMMKTKSNQIAVDREIKMLKHIITIKHDRIASPFDIIQNKSRSVVETLRIQGLLDESWGPTNKDSIADFMILTPLSQATFDSLLNSDITAHKKTTFFTQLLEGVSFLHKQGILHRDIKPANILIDQYSPPCSRITDFGCATTTEPILYDYPGTIPYLAPEQVPGQHHDRSVDYWACGLIGYRLLGGHPPRRQILPGTDLLNVLDSLDRMMMAAQTQSQSSTKGFNKAMVSCCRDMLLFDPARRLTAQNGLNIIMHATADLTPTSSPTGSGATTPKALKRQRM